MKATAAIGCSVFLAMAIASWADLVIVQKVEGAGQAGEQTIRIKGDKARSDLAQPVSTITDGATGEMITLMHAGRTFLRVSAVQTKAMMDQLQKMRPNAEPATLQPTGKKEKIGDYDCEIFTTRLGGMAITYWVAKDYPNYQPLLEQLGKFQGGAISAMGKGLMPEMKDFPGMIMKTEIELGGKKTSTVLVSAKEENVDPAIFNIPAGYKEMASPTLNFAPAK
jgi:hypothetical protein